MRIPKRILFILTSITIAFSSCVTTLQTNYMQELRKTKPAFKDSINYADYRLKEGDKLFIQVNSADSKLNNLFNGMGSNGVQASMNSGTTSDLYTYQVKPDGTIYFPIIGKIEVGEKTLREVKHLFQEEIKSVITPNTVDVRLVTKSFYVVGEGKSGRYSFPKEKVNIYQALAMIGDVGEYTDRSKIRILRQTKTGHEIKTFDIRDISVINSEYYYLEADDIIFLQPMTSKFFGANSLWSSVSTIISTISFATGIYGIITNSK